MLDGVDKAWLELIKQNREVPDAVYPGRVSIPGQEDWICKVATLRDIIEKW